MTTTELVFTGVPGERPSPVRRNTYTKVEGEFIDETTTRSEYIDHRSIQRAEIIKRTDNLTVGEGEFTVNYVIIIMYKYFINQISHELRIIFFYGVFFSFI